MPTVDAVIPVLNEAHVLKKSVTTLHAFLHERELPFTPRIVIADNGSTDGTLAVAAELIKQLPGVSVIHIPVRGRGRALRKAWLESEADVVSYMDVDLSTDLEAFPALITAITEEGYDVAIGSRLARGSQVIGRKPSREVLSRGYNLLIRALFFTFLHDAQCGFKAVSRQAAQELVPLIENQDWFFDTELLLLAIRLGYRIKEVPVRWTDDPDTRVKVARTVWQDLRGLTRMRFRALPRPQKLSKGGKRPP